MRARKTAVAAVALSTATLFAVPAYASATITVEYPVSFSNACNSGNNFGTLPAGKKLTVRGENVGLCTPVDYNGRAGWVDTSFTSAGVHRTMIADGKFSNACNTGSVFGTLKKGTVIVQHGNPVSACTPINYHGRVGWIPTSSLQTSSPSTSPSATYPAVVTGMHGDIPALQGEPWMFTNTEAYKQYSSATDPTIKREYWNLANPGGAFWFGGGSDDASFVASNIKTANSEGKVPEYVYYAIPGRDCGGFSDGGVASDNAYQAWASSMADAMAGGTAIVIMEPDAISFCNSAQTRKSWSADMSFAAKALHDKAPNVAIYIHAGSGSTPVDYAVDALSISGIQYMRGFAMNVSSHGSTADEETYGEKLVKALADAGYPGKHYVVDTSRNGLGWQPNPGGAYQSCNNPNVAIGSRPTTSTTAPNDDAWLWIHGAGGVSDGVCHSGDPASGVWFPALAQKIVQNSVNAGTIQFLPLP